MLVVLAALGAGACALPRAEVAPRAQRLDSLAVEALRFAADQYRRVASENHPTSGYPRATGKDGRWETVRINDWTSGFFPGTLWYLYEHTGDPAFRGAADRWTLPLADIPKGRYTHDLGFQFHSSFVKANRLTREERFRAPALEAARLLAARYNPTVGAIKSWDWTDPKRPYPVIVDNMMNLELLFWAARNGGDPAWRELAIRHARTTLSNHVRPDGGSYHVVVFDPATGRALERITHQGLADSTTWARGQAWLIYGFTMAYRETREPDFLRAAQRVAAYALDRLPSDRVPCWDFQAPGCPATAPRDASAAAVMASGLLELSGYVPGDDGARYRRTAEEILATLASPAYLARGTSSHAILLHSVGHHPKGTEIDVGIAYADYYFVEGLLRYLELRGTRPRTLLPQAARRDSLRVIALRADELERARTMVRAGDPRLKPALDRLRADADSAMREGPFSVTHKKRVLPSGDRHDYMSMGPYWWPDPSKPNGLPYIRRDGERNPETVEDMDSPRLAKLTDAVETLAHAFYFTGEEAYANRAALLLRTWFLDPATRMNPHLRFAQAIPGVVEGRGIGIIDGHRMVRLLDAVAMVEQSSAWSAADREGLKTWMDQYLTWLRTSEHGIDEADEENNHGTWYDAQLAAVALFVGRPEVAREIIEGSKSRRIAAQVEPDGRQPRELARTRPLHYSVFNLEPFMLLAEMGRHVGADLWSYRSPRGASVRAALDYVAPYADPSRRFPQPEVAPPDPDLLLVPLRRARLAYGDPRYEELLRRIPASVTRDHRSLLLYPDPETGERVAAQPGASLNENELRRVRTGRAEELLAGRFAGVEVFKLGDGGITVRIRGASNLQGGGEPLYVIDGMRIAPGPGGALQGINPEDITRIEVLKDIGSIAMYGVEGANGVLLISTRRER